jgi:hypothetical protein
VAVAAELAAVAAELVAAGAADKDQGNKQE